MRLAITGHARQRWREHGGVGRLRRGPIVRRLMGMMRSGSRMRKGRLWVWAGQGLYAVCRPDLQGWVVVTVIPARSRKRRAGVEV